MDTKQTIKASFLEAHHLLQRFTEDENNFALLNHFADLISNCIKNGGKILSCGNGGSMCDAMHFAEELTGRFREDRIALPAMAISDPAHLSCTSNDYGYEFVFSRFVEAFGKEDDILFSLSTSGNSQNIINAVDAAHKKNMQTICLLGKDGGALAKLAKNTIIVPHHLSDRIQEIHIKIIHTLIELTEINLFRKTK